MRGPDELEIVAFERGGFTSYSACGIPYWLGRVVRDRDSLIARSPETFRRDYHIDVRLRHEVTAIDLDAATVTAWDAETGREVTEGFDLLMLGLGARPLRPQLPGADAAGILGVQTLGDALEVAAALERDPRRAVVVGGGYIGLEMAEALVRRGLEVTLVEQRAQPMSSLDEDMGALVADALREVGVVLYTGESVTGFETSDGAVRAVVTEQRTLTADVVVLGLGVRPNVALADSAGLPVGASGALVVDRRLATPAPGVWAAGDCAEKFHRVSRRPVAIALGTYANKEGRTAGINLGGGYASFPGVIGTAASKICDVEVARTGLTAAEARAAGFVPVAATVDSTTRASYFPGASPVKVKLVADAGTGHVLGAQIVGREGAAKRIDAVALAVWNEMDLGELINADLSYAPPFSPLWDPVLIAARKAAQEVTAAT